jgi:hypothetical protein
MTRTTAAAVARNALVMTSAPEASVSVPLVTVQQAVHLFSFSYATTLESCHVMLMQANLLARLKE